ncbi:hypothetical protein DFP73DRAFT_592221 [Morchella snyderi]|nr:hypothetical protein DFP73DRAFT_592221 [Morchella snyderi]
MLQNVYVITRCATSAHIQMRVHAHVEVQGLAGLHALQTDEQNEWKETRVAFVKGYSRIKTQYEDGDLYREAALTAKTEREIEEITRLAEYWSEPEWTPEREVVPAAKAVARTAKTLKRRKDAEKTKLWKMRKCWEDGQAANEGKGKGKEQEDVMPDVEMSEAEWRNIPLQDRVEYAVNTVRDIRNRYIVEIAEQHPDIDMDEAADLIITPETDYDLIYPPAMKVADGNNKRKRRGNQEKECEFTYHDVWVNNATPTADKRKRQYVEKMAKGLMSSMWASAKQEIKEKLLETRHSRGAHKEPERGNRKSTHISIASTRESTPRIEDCYGVSNVYDLLVRSAKSVPRYFACLECTSKPPVEIVFLVPLRLCLWTPRNKDIQRENIPAWGKILVEEVAALGRKVVRLEKKNQSLKEYKDRNHERRNSNRPPPPPAPPLTQTLQPITPVGPRNKESAVIMRSEIAWVQGRGIPRGGMVTGANTEILSIRPRKQTDPHQGRQTRSATREEREKGEKKAKGAEERQKEMGRRMRNREARRVVEEKSRVAFELKEGETETVTATVDSLLRSKGLDESETATKILLAEAENDKLTVSQHTEKWVAIVVYGVDTKWEQEMDGLRAQIEKLNDITLMKEPKWTSKQSREGAMQRTLVIHVKDRETRDKIRGIKLANGYTYSARDIKTHDIKEYVYKAMAKEVQGRTDRAKCGISAKEATPHGATPAYIHKGCENKGWCKAEGHKQTLKCANCNGPHTARSVWCKERENYTRMTMGLERLPVGLHNCNGSTNVMQGLMESGRETDIIAIQEPYIGKIKGNKNVRGATELGDGEHQQTRRLRQTLWALRAPRALGRQTASPERQQNAPGALWRKAFCPGAH